MSIRNRRYLNEVSLWDLKQHRPIWQKNILQDFRGYHCVVANPRDPRFVATLDHDWNVCIWDVDQGAIAQKIESLSPSRGYVAGRQMAFSPEGRHLALAQPNGAIFILRLENAPANAMLPHEHVPARADRSNVIRRMR